MMAEAAWKLGKSEELIDKVNEQISQIALNESEDTCKGARKKAKKKDTKRLVQSATTSPSSNPTTPSHSTPGLYRQNSADNSFINSKKFSGTKSKIPLRQQRLSASDSLCETSRRYTYLHNGTHYPRSIGKSSSSSSSHSSEATATKIKRIKDRFRRSSDSLPEKGYLVPYGLRLQHAAHRCAWSESDNSTSLGSVGLTHTPTMSKRGKSGPSSAASNLSPSTSRVDNGCQQHRASSSRSFSQQSKFDVYLPLCEVQQGLKKGEVLEGVLRINPRNYEDAYISAPDGQMDIYIGGIRDRNRALNGDVVAVRLGPVEDWKIMWENIREYEERKGHSIFDEPPTEVLSIPNSLTAKDEDEDSDLNLESDELQLCSGWDQNWGPRMPDTVEILGVADLQQQIDDFCNEAKKKKRKNRRAKQKKNKITSRDNTSPEPNATTSSDSKKTSQLPTHLTNVHASNGTSLDVNNALLVNDSLISSTDNLASLQLNSNANPVTSCASSDGVGDQLNLSKDASNEPIVIDTWTMEEDKGPRWVVSPEDLLNLDDFEIPQFQTKGSNAEKDTDIADSDEEDCSKVVAPDELSEDDYSPSVGEESNSSQYAEQALEDAAFFASQQDAYNNNSGEDNVIDAYLTLNQGGAPVVQEVPIANEEILVPSNPTSVVAALAEANNYSSSSEEDPVTGLEEKLANVHKVAHPVNMSNWPDQVPDSSHESSNLLPTKCQWEAIAAGAGLAKAKTELKDCDLNPSIDQISKSPVNGEEEKGDNDDQGKKQKGRKRIRKNKKKKLREAADANPQVDVNKIRTDKPICCDTPKKSIKTPNFAGPALAETSLQHHSFTVYDILALPTCGKFVQKTGKVVYIIEKNHSRVAMGQIKLMQDRNPNWALFSPSDHRLPRIFVPIQDCPTGFYERPMDFAKMLFIARITEWEEDSMFAKGRLARSLGEAGEIEPETEGILMEHDVDCSEFSDEVMKDLPQNLPWTIPASEIAQRRDFRKECVFTIDPKTARDLDDAVSCKILSNNVLEVGVHIADVSFFVKDETSLDKVASKRATSVYLVQKVVPMLPRLLCEELCSLNPGQDRLTFSVVWKMTEDGKILDEWFGKTIISSCVKLSYEHAQDMIENPNKNWQPNEIPEITGGYTTKNIVDIVQKLQGIAKNLRQKRFRDGALRLDQVKLQFTLDQETGLPSGYSIHELKDSNRLIEEFMLLANMAVAHKIYNTFPEKAFLRSHEPPQTKMLDDVVALCESLGIILDASSSGALQASLAHYMSDDIFSEARVSVLTHLLSKPMKPATYFCSGVIADPSRFRHYALSVPLYTHFTSPIRRYPDIIVHRLLAAALKIGQLPKPSALQLQKCATNCNQKKLNAKRVHEMSCELFLATFVKECGPLQEKAMVVSVMDHSFDVLIVKMGIIKRIYCDKLAITNAQFEKKKSVPHLILTWKRNNTGFQQILTLFLMVDVILTSTPRDPMKFQAVMKPPF